MKRSTMKPSTKPIRRAPFDRNGALARASSAALRAARKAAPAKKAKRKPAKPKSTPIRRSANGEECTLRFPCCNFDPATTVWCHSNEYADGKGMGVKAHDAEGCYGCSNCHAFLDGGYANAGMPRSLVRRYFDIAREISQQILRRKGLIA